MTCVPLVNADRTITGYVCRPTIRHTNVWQSKFCFVCRRRRPHRLAYTNDAYYDPEPVWRCGKCHRDHTAFPST